MFGLAAHQLRSDGVFVGGRWWRHFWTSAREMYLDPSTGLVVYRWRGLRCWYWADPSQAHREGPHATFARAMRAARAAVARNVRKRTP